MSNYKYNGVDIYYLLNSSGISNTTPYIGFPLSPYPSYTSQIDIPQPFNYKENSVDLCNTNEAFTLNYPGSVYGTFNISYPMYISGLSGPSYKHISGYCIGGSGGGGGGGGAHTGVPQHSGGKGGTGGQGGYAAIVQYPINGNISLIIGQAGNGGNNGKGDSNGGANGGIGNEGTASTLIVGNTTILNAWGGGSGNGGDGGNANSDGKAGTTNAGPTPNFAIANGGKNNTIDPNTPSYPYWPPNISQGGLGGIGQAGDGTPNAAPGNPGNNGYAQLWFSYIA